MSYRWITNLQTPVDDVDGNFLNVLEDYRLGPPVPTPQKDRKTMVLDGVMGVYTTAERIQNKRVVSLTALLLADLSDVELGEEYESYSDLFNAGRVRPFGKDTPGERDDSPFAIDSVLPGASERPAMSLADLFCANEFVNHSISYRTDSELYGEIDKWEYPKGQGDCEDFALAKRALLIQGGYDPKLLNIAICLDHSGTGHAVLIATLGDQDYVLDNQTDDVLAWVSVGYHWIKITRDGSFLHWDEVKT